MASRPVWSGFIRFSLVSIPVRAYTAAVSGGGGAPTLNQLHAECHSRIQYKKTCPVHGEVPNDQIVSGYQFAKDQYVIVDKDEIEKLVPKSAKDISIEAFLKPGAIDPGQFSGKSYYLAPNGPVAQKPYALLVKSMADQKVNAFAQVVMHGSENIVLLRPVGKVLMMSMLNYAQDLKPIAEFEAEVADVDLPANELKLAKTLTEQLLTDDFDIAQYKDAYAENLTKLIQLRVEGKEIVEPPDTAPAPALNLVDALEQSLARTRAKKSGKPPKIVAPSPASKASAARKRKTS